MTVFFTADTHFGHSNIIKYCNRPFDDVVEMNNNIISRWNHRVKDEDTVYHLGDFSFANQYAVSPDRLRGNKILIRGNHDPRHPAGFQSVLDYCEMTIEGTRLILFHYALRTWNRLRHGAVMLYGHSHGTLPGNRQSLDVGVDCWDFRPVTLGEIKDRLQELPEIG